MPDLRGNNYRKALIGHVAKFSQDYCSRHPVRLLPENDHNKVVNRQTLETVQNQIDEGLRPGQLDNSVLYSNLATEIRQPRETHKPVSRTTRNNIRQLYFNSSQHAGSLSPFLFIVGSINFFQLSSSFGSDCNNLSCANLQERISCRLTIKPIRSSSTG